MNRGAAAWSEFTEANPRLAPSRHPPHTYIPTTCTRAHVHRLLRQFHYHLPRVLLKTLSCIVWCSFSKPHLVSAAVLLLASPPPLQRLEDLRPDLTSLTPDSPHSSSLPALARLHLHLPASAPPSRAVDMPPINQAALSAGVVVASMAVAAAIAIYESPELQRMANDLRRKIAIALHSLGDGILPETANGEPLFNRPEDAQGFLHSAEVDADDETRRRQREELMYWNALKLSKELDQHTAENEKRKGSTGSSTTFDDFLQEDKLADEKGTYVFNTGADVRANDEQGIVRRRGLSEGVRGLNASLYANPFADEHGIDYDEQMEESHIAPDKDEVFSDIYNATPRDTPASPPSRTMTPVSVPDLIPIEPEPQPMPATAEREIFSQTKSVSQQSDSPRSSRPESTIPEFEYTTAGQDDQHDAYASIQAWAQQQQQQQSGMDFYSPLPITPTAPRSEMSDGELISEGQLTPTDSASVAESGVDIANDLASHDGSSPSVNHYDVMSEDEDGIATPAHSWTEVGSVVSESEDGMQHAQRA